MSAPKKIGTRDKPIFDFSINGTSPGISPSVYAIPNFAIDCNKDVFFNSSISISDLKYLGEIGTILEEDLSPDTPLSGIEKYEIWISKSTSAKPSDPIKFHQEIQNLKKLQIIKGEDLFNESKPPGFEKPWTEYSSDSDLSSQNTQNKSKSFVETPNIENNQILLKQPPKVGLVKRENRGKFNEEEVSYEKYTGRLKFYQLKKRFGFISLDEDDSDVFLCEDDLILSGVLYKKFKEDVFKKVEIKFEFNIKKYMENDKEKRKAINICII